MRWFYHKAYRKFGQILDVSEKYFLNIWNDPSQKTTSVAFSTMKEVYFVL